MPLPVPALDVVIQFTPLTALQLQPAPAVTVMLPLPPAEVNDALVGEIEYVQAAPLCVTVCTWPLIVTVPVRELVLPLAATE